MKANPEDLTIQTLLRLVLSATTLLPLASLLVLVIVAGGQAPSRAVTGIVFTMLLGAVAIVGATIFLHRLLSRRINERILELIDVCRNYAGGDQTVRARVAGDDLFSLLAQFLNTLLDSQDLNEGEEDVRRREEYRISAQQVQVERLLHEVRSIAQGDLPLQSGVSSQTLGLLADSFAYLIEGFSQAVKQVHLSAVQVHNETLLMQSASDGLYKEGIEELTALAHLTEEVEGTAVFLQQVARNVQVGAENAEKIVVYAQQGKIEVHQALEGMTSVQHAVGESAKTVNRLRMEASEIYEAFSQLDDVVSQADLLARNATLQATFQGGGPGQTGVLADDLTRLTSRIESVSKRLGLLLGHMHDEAQGAERALEGCLREVAMGVRQVENAGRDLSELALETGRTAHLFRQFTDESDEQARHFAGTAEEHARIVARMVETHARRQEVEQSVAVLSHLNDQLRAFVSTIKVPDIPYSIEQDQMQTEQGASWTV